MKPVLKILAVSSLLTLTSSASFLLSTVQPIGIRQPSSTAGAVQCAIVFGPGWAQDWYTNPVRAFCPLGGQGKTCDAHNTTAIRCHEGHELWYQRALDMAGGLNEQGEEAHASKYPAVYLTRGVIELKKVLKTSFPFEGPTGLHVPSSVALTGVPRNFGETVIRPSSSGMINEAGEAVPSLSSLILLSPTRTGNLLAAKPVENSSIANLTLIGSPEFNTHACDRSSTRRQAQSGIAAPSALGNIRLAKLLISQVNGNAIDTGLFLPWIAEDPQCTTELLCRGRVLRFSGLPEAPNHIAANRICQTGFGGITLIGSDNHVYENHISAILKTWVDSSKGVGSTMAISAGFVGSGDNTISHNYLESADYGIGTDGSYPQLYSEAILRKYWPQIYSKQTEAFKKAYNPHAPPDGLKFASTIDYLLATQAILDLAGEKAQHSGDFDSGFIYGLKIFGNTINNSTAGICLFKTRDARVYENSLSSMSFNRFGLYVDNSVNAFAWRNTFRWWNVAVQISGQPGQVTRLGASYNGIGSNPNDWTAPGNFFIGNKVNSDISRAGNGNTFVNPIVK